MTPIEKKAYPSSKKKHPVRETGEIRPEQIISETRKPAEEQRSSGYPGSLRPGRKSPADISGGAGGRSEYLLGWFFRAGANLN